MSKAAALLAQHEAMRRIIRRSIVLYNRVAMVSDLSRCDRGQILTWMFCECVFWGAALLDHEGLNVYRKLRILEGRGSGSLRAV
jgi:hypothetical protein